MPLFDAVRIDRAALKKLAAAVGPPSIEQVGGSDRACARSVNELQAEGGRIDLFHLQALAGPAFRASTDQTADSWRRSTHSSLSGRRGRDLPPAGPGKLREPGGDGQHQGLDGGRP